MQVKRIGVLSAAKLTGVVYACLGLIAGCIFALFSLVGAGIAGMAHDSPEGAPWFTALFGVGAVVILPVMYGFFGFVGGALMSAVYNVVARFVGGLEVELG